VLVAGCSRESPSGPEDTAAVVESDIGTPVTSGARAPSRAWHIRAGVATTPAAAPAGCLLYFTSVITGHATHLGAFSGEGSTCITGLIQPDPDPPFVPAGPGPYFTAAFVNPSWTLTASNGDQLFIENYDAVAVISLVDNSLRAEGRMRIVGGTGRFAGATGEALVGAVNDDGQGPDDFSGSGWIRYDASNAARR
jgi:hypothetical protein